MATQKSQRGVALIEVLICFFVLSIGLLGMAALQMKAMQYNQSAYMRSQATVAANDMLDQIRLNNGAAPVPGLAVWQANLVATLPGAVPNIVCPGRGVACTISITWNDTASAAADSVVIQTEM